MNKRHRVFIAVNLLDKIKKRLADYQERWPELPVRRTKRHNLHITLFFLGYLIDEEIVEVCKIVKEVALRHSSFSVDLNRICYGPEGKIPPRIIWARGDKSSEFASLRNDLNESLASYSKHEKKEFSPHITLGRIRAFEWRRIEPEERPEIEEDINLSIEVNSIEVMESVLKRQGPEYAVLESSPLKL